MKKKSAALVLISLSTMAFGAYSYSNRGLDNNSIKNIDYTLETRSSEEDYFDDVADLISGFVVTQKKIRHKIAKILKQDSFFLSSDKKEKYKKIISDLPNKGQYASRDVHRKTHGCYEAKLDIESSLQDDLNDQIQLIRDERSAEFISSKSKNRLPELVELVDDLGVFKPGMNYNAIVRLSNGHPGNRHDRLPDARGFAVKILPTDISLKENGALVANKNTMLDILTINFPTFFVNSAVKYKTINKWFLKSAEDNQGFLAKLYEGYSVFAPKILKGSGMTKLEQKLALKVNGSVIAHPLYEEYFSMVPSRLGKKGQSRAVKYVWKPASCHGGELEHKDYFTPKWSQTHNYSYPLSGIPSLNAIIFPKETIPPFKGSATYWNHYYLRDRVENTLKKNDFCYELYGQLYRDQRSTNIEDSTDVWLSSEKERASWMARVAGELKDAGYTKKIKAKRITPRIKIGTLRIAKIERSSRAENTKNCEDLSFNPWHGDVAHHKPLGQISRLKQKVYNAVRRTRHELNAINSKSLERLK
ncbi:MAG: hypothetical protein ACJAT2_002852 [Bacteriovoracaceae bacterium]|jgi:hypothetical protein